MKIFQPVTSVESGSTGISSYTVGDILVADGTFHLTTLTAVASGRVLASTGAGTLPAYTATPTLTSVTLGSLTLNGGGSGTLTFPSGTTNFTATGGTGQVVQQTSVGGALTVSQLTATDLSNGTTGTGLLVLQTSPSLITPNIGVPSAGTLTNCTGLPISTGVTGLAAGVITFLTTPSSANLASAITNETGTGLLVFNTSPSLTTPTLTSPTLVTPILGTPTSGTLTNCTGLPISTGVSGLATGIATFLATPSSANLAAAVTDETGSGALVFATSPTLVTPLLGTPTSGTLTNCTGLPISTGVSGLGTNVATFLGTPSSANLAAAVTDETGSGALVFANTPTLVTPNIGAATGTSLSVTGLLTSKSGTGATAGGVQALVLGSSAPFGIYWGSGAPTASADQGSLYLRTDGSSTTTRMYVNTDGATAWTHVVTGA